MTRLPVAIADVRLDMAVAAGPKHESHQMEATGKRNAAGSHVRFGNPFSEDEELHEKPLLIASAGSSYAMDQPHRFVSISCVRCAPRCLIVVWNLMQGGCMGCV